MSRAFWKSKRRRFSSPRPKARANFWCRTAASPGTFYALPQSPQQFKQILMVAGVERYFQLARCFAMKICARTASRNSPRSISRCRFIEREDIYALIEGLLKRVWKTALNMDIPTPFKRISFEEALNRYGIDKPDTRFGMELVDFTEEFRGEHVQSVQRRDCQRRRGESAERQRHGRRDAGPDRDHDRIRQEFRRERSGLHQSRRTANGNRPS